MAGKKVGGRSSTKEKTIILARCNKARNKALTFQGGRQNKAIRKCTDEKNRGWKGSATERRLRPDSSLERERKGQLVTDRAGQRRGERGTRLSTDRGGKVLKEVGEAKSAECKQGEGGKGRLRGGPWPEARGSILAGSEKKLTVPLRKAPAGKAILRAGHFRGQTSTQGGGFR